MIHTLNLKQLELSTDVSTVKSDVLLQHETSESRDNRDSLWGTGPPGCHLPVTPQCRFCMCASPSVSIYPPPTHASCSVFSHHVLREARRGPAAVQDGRDRGAVRVRHRHGHVLLRPLGHDQEHLRGRRGGEHATGRELVPWWGRSCFLLPLLRFSGSLTHQHCFHLITCGGKGQVSFLKNGLF